MLGQRVPHPLSTNFYEAEPPPAKRLKQSPFECTVQNLTEVHKTDETRALDSSRDQEIAGLGLECGESDTITHIRRTNLESALPFLETDKEAIYEYEISKAPQQAEQRPLPRDSGECISSGRKSSIYVDAFKFALETVLNDESHLFDRKELAVFKEWRSLDYETQFLYVRLFLRKTAAWHRINRLRYHEDVGDLESAVGRLLKPRQLPETKEPEEASSTTFESTFSFADCSDDHITTIEEASSLLLLDELKDVAKEAKVQGKTKSSLLKALRQNSQTQSGIGWRTLMRSDTEESESQAIEDFSENIQDNRDAHYVRRILTSTGRCIRLSSAPFRLFERVHLVFYRSTEWTEKSLTTVILAKTSRRNFPEYVVSRSANIFPTRAILLEFEAALRTQFHIDNILEFSGYVDRPKLQEVKAIAGRVYPRWRTLIEEEEGKDVREYESSEGAYLRRFSPAWVYTRIIHKGLASLARFKEHAHEHSLLKELLDQRLFHAARRGAWYQRKALIEEHYMWALTPFVGQDEEKQKRGWKYAALATCEQGLQDRECHLIYHYDLQKRINKLERQLKVAKRLQHDFSHVFLAKPSERTFYGIRIERTSPKIRRRRSSTPPRIKASSGKTVWLDEREGDGECGVEAMCLSKYRDLGFKGYHTEGGLIRTLFGLLFYEILFAYVPNVFQTPFQTCPLDLHTDAFFAARFSEVTHLLARLSNGEALSVFRRIWEQHNERQTSIVGVDWSFAKEDLEEILECFPGEALAVVCKIMAQEYQQRGGGLPDLFLWHPEKKQILFAEVKSENDKLSDTQRLWIHVLAGAGVNVELCNAVAKEVKIS